MAAQKMSIAEPKNPVSVAKAKKLNVKSTAKLVGGAAAPYRAMKSKRVLGPRPRSR